LLDLPEKDKQNVLNETQSLVKLRSEYVIQYYYSWIECNCLYFQMELCFDNLTNFLETKKLLFNELITKFDCYISLVMFRELTECVQYLHESVPQIIHRDLKPDNVLISMDGRIKLCDFGLAKEVANTDWYRMSKTKHTADVGDLLYQAPEVNSYPIDYNHLIDIYSLSLIGSQIFGFDSYDIIDGKYVLILKFYKILNIIIFFIKFRENINNNIANNVIKDIMIKMNALLVSMSVNMYSQNGSTDWRQRPECSHILSQLQTFMINERKIYQNEFKLFCERIIERQCDVIYKLFMNLKPFCEIRMSNIKTGTFNLK